MSLRVCLYNLTTTTQVGGVETFVIELARSLARLGHRPVIVGGTGPYEIQVPGVQIIRFPFVDRSVLRKAPILYKAYGFTKLVERLSFACKAVPVLSKQAFDVIHIQKPYDLMAGTMLKRRTGAVLILSSHGRDFFPGDRLFTSWVDGATACSLFNAKEALMARYRLKGAVVYNGVDIDHFSYKPDPELRERLLRREHQLVLSVGRLIPWKGIDTVLRAVAEVRAKGLKVAAAVAGEGPARKDLEDLTFSLGMAEAVTFLGNVGRDTMPYLMSSCDLLAAGSFANETFGIVLAEAMACQRPVVATRFGGFPEVVEDGVTGLLVPPLDPGAMALALEHLLTHPEKAAGFGQAGRRRVEEMFTWEAVTARVLKVYAQALESRGHRP